MRTTIPWGDGTQDNIYLDYAAAAGDQAVAVSSDANGSAASRTKVVTFSAPGASPVSLTVSQDAPSLQPVFYDLLIFDGTAFVQTDIPMPSNGSIAARLGNETKKASQVVFNFKPLSGEGNIRYFLGSNTSATRRQTQPQYDSTTYLLSNTYLDFTYPAYNFFLTPKGMGFGSAFNSFNKGSSVHPTGGFCLGFYSDVSQSTTQRYTGRAGEVRIFNSDAQNVQTYTGFANYTPHRILRPCTYGGQAGLWCVETSTFYGNSAGAGTLTVGNL